jgi:hypothetical protein
VGCFFIGKQKVILFPKYRENGWETAASALTMFRKFVGHCSTTIYNLY